MATSPEAPDSHEPPEAPFGAIASNSIPYLQGKRPRRHARRAAATNRNFCFLAAIGRNNPQARQIPLPFRPFVPQLLPGQAVRHRRSSGSRRRTCRPRAEGRCACGASCAYRPGDSRRPAKQNGERACHLPLPAVRRLPQPAAACQPLPAAYQLPPSAARRNPHSQIGRPESRELRPSFLQATNLQRFPRVRRHAYGGALASGNSAAIPAASDAASEQNAPTSPSCMRLGAGINLAQRNRGPTAPDPSC